MALRQRQLCLSRSYFCSVCSNDSTLRMYLWSWKSMAIMAPYQNGQSFGGEIRIFRRITLLGIHISYITMLTCHEVFPWMLHEVPWNPLKSHEQWSTHVKPTCLMAKLLQWIRAFHGFPTSVNSDVSNSSQVLEVWPSSSTCATGTGTWDSRQQNAGGGPENGWGPSNRPIGSIE